MQIDHQAFSYQRIEQAVDEAGDPRLLHDVPDQQAVVAIDQPRVVAGGADQALEPPVGGVDAVGVVIALEAGTGPRQAIDQRLAAVDAHVPLVGAAVVVGQRPADAFGQVARDADHQRAAGLEHAQDLRHGRFVVGNVFQHLAAHHGVEAGVGKGQAGDVGRRQVPAAAAVFTQAVVEVEALARLGEVADVEVRTGDPNAFKPVGRRRVAAGTASDI